MGTSTFVNHMATRPAEPTGKTPKKTSGAKQGMDWILFGLVVGLTLFGLLMIYSASTKFTQDLSTSQENLGTEYFLFRQAIWAAIGLVAIIVLSRINYHRYQRLTVLMMGVTLLALVWVAFFGVETLGANRSMFFGSVRPSELAKLVTIIYVSVWLTAKSEVLNDITLGLFPLMLILGITGGLIVLQPDLSAALTIVILGGVLFFLAGGEWRQIALTMVVAGLVGWVIVNVSQTGMDRIQYYIGGLRNLLNASYHVQRSLEAVINGGLFGVGIGHSSTKFTGLPVAPTDSIFAVIAEETGLIGAGFVILAYLVFLWRGLAIAHRAPDKLGSLLASGITIWIVIEAMLNMAVMVNLLPQVGNALPLISYGGSSLTITLAAIGILLNISRLSSKSNSSTGGNPFGAVVDLRWRDRRRGLPRFGRSSGSRR
jgi:cell division protein FtsW